MEVHRDIELCEPCPFLYFDNGQLALTDGRAVWMVIVTREAIDGDGQSAGGVAASSRPL